MRQTFKKIIIISSLSFAFLSMAAYADDAADIGKLLRSGQTSEALQKVDAALAIRPKDAQMRFLKGLILTEQNKTTEAINIFMKLTDDYPELPEPYNNLAVLYASSGQYDKARASLEMAIRTNPTYGTAHENLGDVYAKLASQAYDKALQLDSGNTNAKLKLTLVRNLVGNTTGGTNPKNNPSPATQVAQLSAQPKPAATSKIEKIEPETAKSIETTNPSKSKVQQTQDKEDDEVIKAIENWAKAWSNKDTNTYLAHYAKDFQTPKGESRKAWAEERRNRIEGKGRISVKIETPKVNLDGNSATVKFRQIYTSDQLTANSRKTILMIKQDGKWLIKQERAGS
ncbi:nuclear transport factor 2 family protein [Undibacterium oligocarboniphilum]|uniref:Tetratricopeptide repeat protein n=1 Tax=Undibacterium oligocarboniphilum TaxID=666702 RepID=A0A850QKJ8_9BURK|nr:nuclear transport factor 2 family protein [Undibacterium oligocarboniphilum]MBC3868705.1 tetratricopeptide repeat protein [Undibacterium oligocarboniphilum]NVO76686.1 tetratricopeptide repeat protein [Undibacterium oligocarboniphilum]